MFFKISIYFLIFYLYLFIYIFFFFFFFFGGGGGGLFICFYWRVKVLKFTHVIYVVKNWSVFLNKIFQKQG